MLKDFCKVCNIFDEDFIGLRFVNGKPIVSFPRGFRLSDNDAVLRQDIIHLLAVLYKFNNKAEGSGNKTTKDGEMTIFPIHSYQYIIYDFISNGYYSDKDVEYQLSDRGKVDWKRTINQTRPMVDGGNIVFLQLITKKSINKADVITKIHEYCVYESFSKLGWLYLSSSFVPRKPSVKFNKKLFLSVLNDALKHTFNNNKKLLFSSMIDIINMADDNADFPDASFGVTKFEKIWEKLIDYVYGEENKTEYFPHGHYVIIKDGKLVESSALLPDTIMRSESGIYVLDAKYYKYGVKPDPTFLPPTSSIHKQITYGDYISANKNLDDNDVYNAFIIPFDSQSDEKAFELACIGTGDWVQYNENTANHKYVAVILLDTSHIINTYARHNMKEIDRMACFIAKSLKKYRKETDNRIMTGNKI